MCQKCCRAARLTSATSTIQLRLDPVGAAERVDRGADEDIGDAGRGAHPDEGTHSRGLGGADFGPGSRASRRRRRRCRGSRSLRRCRHPGPRPRSGSTGPAKLATRRAAEASSRSRSGSARMSRLSRRIPRASHARGGLSRPLAVERRPPRSRTRPCGRLEHRLGLGASGPTTSTSPRAVNSRRRSSARSRPRGDPPPAPRRATRGVEPGGDAIAHGGDRKSRDQRVGLVKARRSHEYGGADDLDVVTFAP